MQKDFDAWNEDKKRIDQRSLGERFFFKEGDVWWSAMGLNVGHEENGKGDDFCRPVLILKKFNQYFSHVVPLSTRLKESPYHAKCSIRMYDKANDGHTLHTCVALVSQSRAMSSNRLLNKIGYIDREDSQKIKEAISTILL